MGSKYDKLGNDTPITNFYKRKFVLITGVTGFLGTVLLEKLLFSCPDVESIYVLMKPKKGLTAKERLEKHLKSEAFKRVQELNPEVLDKVVAMSGDLVAPKFGLNAEDMETLRANVSIVFHVAANVSFDLSVEEAVNVNTTATGKLLEFCKTFSKLQAFIYVSTAFCNCKENNDVVEEKVYQTRTSVRSALYTIKNNPDNFRIMKSLIDGRPNRYAYSKALAEQLIGSEYSGLPVAIVRPSVIIGALKEPANGWVHGFSGANNVVLLQGMGLLRVWFGDKNAILDVIPVDFVANLLVAAAWDVFNNRSVNEVKVYNSCSGMQNPLTMGRLMDTTSRCSKVQYKGENLLPPTIVIVKSPVLYSIAFFVFHTIPAYLVHWLCVLCCQKSQALQLRQKLIRLVHHLKFFASNQFTFVDQNVMKLYLKMEEKDQIIFDFNIRHINWDTYLNIFVCGLKKYLSKRL